MPPHEMNTTNFCNRVHELSIVDNIRVYTTYLLNNCNLHNIWGRNLRYTSRDSEDDCFYYLECSLVPLIKGLFSSDLSSRFCFHIFCFSISEGNICKREKAISPRSHPASQRIYTHMYFVHMYEYICADI